MNSEIWEDQLFFNQQFFRDQGLDLNNLTLKEKIHWAKEFCFHINKEMADLVNCLPHWKMHYQNDEREDNQIVTSNLIEEYIDVLKYFMGLGQLLGISYEDIARGYEEKSEVVKQKYEQNKKFESLLNNPVVIFDIDGVINNYPICFLDWANQKLHLSTKSVKELKEALDLKAYQEIKIEYRLSGLKRVQPVNQTTVKLMETLKKKGETIILFTNRPVSQFKVIYVDTLYWLRTNHIPFDAIYWSDFQRKEDIYKLRFKIKYIVEDDLENTKNFIHEGHKVFLLNKPYNEDSSYKNENLIRIVSPLEILGVVDVVSQT